MAIDLYKNRCSVYEGGKPYIFVSYSHRDIEKVVALIRKLQTLGFRVWYDSGIPAGTEWREEIAAHLKNSKCVLSLLTPNSVGSKHFKREFNYADYLGKDILAVYLETCEPSPGLEMQVVSQQCIKCEHCENDEDLLEEIAGAKILQSCLGEKPRAQSDIVLPFSEPKSKPKMDVRIERLRTKAEKGDAQAQSDLGLAYEQGNGLPQNWEEAIKWYLKAAEQGHAWAQTQLGLCYYYGNGVDQDVAEAAKWYRKAAEQGQAAGQFNLGFLYYNGLGVELDEAEAVKWYQLSADQNFAFAQNSLGICYERGEGVERDIAKALELYRRSAEQGNGAAQENLGLCYEFSKGTRQDWEAAVHWYRKAAAQGLVYSQKRLIQCYREGLGVPKDDAMADYWQKIYDENPNK